MVSLEEGMAEIIFDLIRINNDRADCYRNVIIESSVLNTELIEIVRGKLYECCRNAEELTALTVSLGVEYSGNIIDAGQIFRVWNAAGKMVNTKDRKALINDCDRAEATALEAYKTALTSNSLKNYDCRALIMDQKYALQVSQDVIRKYCDLQELIVVTRYHPLLIRNKNFQTLKAG